LHKNISIILTIILLFFPSLLMGDENVIPEEYEDEEFPEWVRDLRRGEIVTVGIFPFAFLLTTIAYDSYRYASNDFDSLYTPGPFNPIKPPLSNEETAGVLLTALGISVFFASVDFILGKIEDKSN
jgi:hypothetical protein